MHAQTNKKYPRKEKLKLKSACRNAFEAMEWLLLLPLVVLLASREVVANFHPGGWVVVGLGMSGARNWIEGQFMGVVPTLLALPPSA